MIELKKQLDITIIDLNNRIDSLESNLHSLATDPDLFMKAEENVKLHKQIVRSLKQLLYMSCFICVVVLILTVLHYMD